MPKKETIQVRPPRARDDDGDPWGPEPAWVDIPGATVVPRESQDYEQRGPIIISGFMVAVGPAAVVGDNYEVKVRGEVYQIEGAVGDYGKRKIFYVSRPN